MRPLYVSVAQSGRAKDSKSLRRRFESDQMHQQGVYMSDVDEAVYDYLMEKVGLWERTIKEIDKGNFMYTGTLPPLPGTVSYGEFIDKVKEIANKVRKK